MIFVFLIITIRSNLKCVRSMVLKDNEKFSRKAPSLEEVDRVVERALKEIFQENYPLSVIKYKKGLYLILPVEFFHFPPAILSCEPDSDDPTKVLYVIVSLRIPVPCENLVEAVMRLRNVLILDIEQVPLGEEGDEKICYLNIGIRLHSLGIVSDPRWFLMMLSSVLRSPFMIYPRIREKAATKELSKLEEAEISTRSEDESAIW